MQDQRNNPLFTFYKNSIEKAKHYLEAKYPLTVCDEDQEVSDIKRVLPSESEYKTFQFWKIQVDGSLRKFTFILSIPDTFPDIYPRIYMSKEDYEEIHPVPHLDKYRFVCTRDPDAVPLSDKIPERALEELIKIGVNILESGIRKANQGDFVEEFLAYWNEKSSGVFLSLFAPTDEVTYLKVFELSCRIFGAQFIVSDSEEYIEKWLVPFQITINKDKRMKALYLPLSEPIFPFIETNGDVLNIVKDLSDQQYSDLLGNYFNHTDNPLIISSFSGKGEERILFCWRHRSWKNQFFKGFRRAHVPLRIRLTRRENDPIDKIKIIRLDKRRIFKRVETRLRPPTSHISPILIGCGSLGSHLAMSLSRCGISKFFLIDKERLQPENVPRHLCGFVEASQKPKKVEAVKKKLSEHFPHINCQTKFGDILQLLLNSKIKLKDYNLIISTTGNFSVERRINYLMRKGLINMPIIYLWIEPFGVGGQLLHIHPHNGGCYECCFDSNGEFLYSVAAPNQSFLKRESGCQSSYLPYSSLNIEHFISVACQRVLQSFEEKPKVSTLYTWLGDLKCFEELGYRVNDMYSADFSYNMVERSILPRETCELCRNNRHSV